MGNTARSTDSPTLSTFSSDSTTIGSSTNLATKRSSAVEFRISFNAESRRATTVGSTLIQSQAENTCTKKLKIKFRSSSTPTTTANSPTSTKAKWSRSTRIKSKTDFTLKQNMVLVMSSSRISCTYASAQVTITKKSAKMPMEAQFTRTSPPPLMHF